MSKPLTGKFGKVTIEVRAEGSVAFEVPVAIVNERKTYGRHELQVEQVGGPGKAWVKRKAVKV